MNPLSLIPGAGPFLAFGAKHWRLIAIAGLVAAIGVQTMRLNHAKADQFDRTACVRGRPCKPPKWRAEVAYLRPELVAAQRDLVTCRGSVQTLDKAVAGQNASIAALKADGDRRASMLSDALQSARKTAATANERAEAILTLQPSGDGACAQLIDLDRQLNGGRP